MKKWMKVLTSGAMMASAATLCTACSNGKNNTKEYEKSLSWMTTSEVQTLDQNKMVDTASGEQAGNIFEGLILWHSQLLDNYFVAVIES